MRRADLADLTAFVAVADNLSFRAAASGLGVTPSALSHTMRHFEERLGFRLLNRTTRSVSLTDAGLRLLDRLRPAVEQISRGLDDLKSEQGHPFGNLRLYLIHLAGAAVIAPVWARFLSTFPDVQLEVHTAEAPVDIVAKGFDAGIGPKDWAAADMIAVRVTGPMRVAVVGAPTYFARRRPPRMPDDLARHSCVQYRRAAGSVFEWPFERDGKSRQISLDGRVMVNDMDLAVRAAIDGLGIAYTIEALADPFLRSGQLVRVLEDWSPFSDGLFLYYPGHRQVPVALRALIDMLHAARSAAPTRGLLRYPSRPTERVRGCRSGGPPRGWGRTLPARRSFMNVSHCHIKFVAIVKRPLRPHLRLANSKTGSPKPRRATRRSPLNPEHSNMSEYDNDHLCSLRTALLDHPLYAQVASVADLRRFMEDHVFAVWDFMSLLKRLQQDMTCTRVPWFPADNAKAARLINDIVIGEETDVDPDGSYVSHLALYLRAMADIGASTRQFEKFRSLVLVGIPVEIALERTGAPRHVQAFVAHTMALANSGSTEEVLAAFFYGREDIIPEMFRRLLDTLYGAKHDTDRLRHFIYYIDRHIELDGDSHGPMGRELLNDLIAHSPHRGERALQAACSSIKARIELWNGTLSKLRYSRGAERSVECDVPNGRWAGVKMAGAMERF